MSDATTVGRQRWLVTGARGMLGSDLLARCVQHETDHLDGVLFVDRLDPDTRRQAMADIRAAEWAHGPAPVVKVSPHPTFGRAL